MRLSFHDRLLTMANLAKREIQISSPCLLCGVNLETAAHIFLHYPLSLELWASKRNRFVIFSWLFSIASLWGDWRLSNIPHNEANRCDCVVNAIFWVV